MRNSWLYLPMRQRVRTRIHRRTGEIQQQTVGSGVVGWRKAPPRAPMGAEDALKPARYAIDGHFDVVHGAGGSVLFGKCPDTGHYTVGVSRWFASGRVFAVAVLHKDNCDAGPLARLVSRDVAAFSLCEGDPIETIIEAYLPKQTAANNF